jgi:uncharacterized protein
MEICLSLLVEEGTGRVRALWRLLAQFVAYVVLVTLLTSLLATVWFFLGSPAAAPGGGARSEAASLALVAISSPASLLAALSSVWLAGRFLDRRPFVDFGFHLGGGWWLDLLFGMALGAVLMTAIFAVELYLGWVTVTGALRSLLPGLPFALGILLPAATFLCTAVSEETLSRGYQLRNAAEGLNHPVLLGPRGAVLAAWALSSAFFGALHVTNPNATAVSTFNIVLAGLMLGFGYVLTGELAIPIGVHLTWNFFQGAVYGLPVSGLKPVGATFLSVDQSGPTSWTGGPFGPEAGLLGPAAMMLGLFLIALWVRLRRGKIDVHAPIALGPPAGGNS